MLRRGGLLVALTALLVPAVAGTTANAKTRSPVVTRITPKHVYVGETMTIRGHHFRRGLNKNTVAFKRDGAKAVFVTAAKGTTKMLRFELPKRLERILLVKNGTPTPTRLRVRVLAAKFGKRYSKLSSSPIVGPEKPPAPPKPAAVDPNGDCDGDGVINSVDSDDDNDLLSDTQEKSLRLDECNVDSDGDGVEDGYEYQSARDLNDDEDQDPNAYLPYPAKKPYPNPLDKTDVNTDHDGDSLTLIQEYRLWKYSTDHGAPRTLERLTYSAGEQYSESVRAGGTGRRTPTLSRVNYPKQTGFLSWATQAGYDPVALADLSSPWYAPRTNYSLLDANRDGSVSADEQYYFNDGFTTLGGDTYLDDSERDEDGDGLTNFDETRGCMNRSLWDNLYKDEAPYPLEFAGTDLDDPDSDGDGVLDGADDQDHDDIPNIVECSRSLAAAANGGTAVPLDSRTLPAAPLGRPAQGFVNPFNPCLPHTQSRTCLVYIDVTGTAFAPFDDSKKPPNTNKYYYIWN
jgi:IPT/TIG domain-containing protein